MMNLNEIAHHPEARVVARFEHAGLECLVLNMYDSHYCGYVKTPFDGHFEEFNKLVNVHGGLSYGVDERGWLGFDTAHAFDVPTTEFGETLSGNPIGDFVRDMGDEQTEWYPEDVMEETAKLAEQFAEIIPEGHLQEDTGEVLD